jgi:ATP-dependent Clp protease ATP-binding subunit ClpC
MSNITSDSSKPGDLPFTDAARQLLADARIESDRLRHEYIASEHLVLALARQPDAAATLARLDIDPERVHTLIAEKVVRGHAAPAPGVDRPYTTRTKQALSFATESARTLGHRAVGVEHLVIGVLRERKTIGAQVLEQCGLSAERVSEQLQRSVPDGSAS